MKSLFIITFVVSTCAVAVYGQFSFGNFFRPRPAARPQPQQAAFSGGQCRPSAPNHSFGGKSYVLSWLNGCSQFTGNEAASYCASMNMRAISLDDPNKAQHFISQLAGDRSQTYFWTGGNVNHRAGFVQWSNGVSQPFNSIRFWSRTGGLGRPQPDNREGGEVCLAVLKGVYNDGVVFHDVNCSHRKPTICEA